MDRARTKTTTIVIVRVPVGGILSYATVDAMVNAIATAVAAAIAIAAVAVAIAAAVAVDMTTW